MVFVESQNRFLAKAVKYSAAGTVLAFSSSVALAVWAAQGYALFFQLLSDLGVGNGAPYYFNYGCMLTAAFIFAFFASLGAIERENWKAKPKHLCAWHWLATIGMLAGIVAALALAGVGFFPKTSQPMHSAASMVFFISAAVAVFLFTVNKKLQGTSSRGTMGAGGLFIALGLLFGFTRAPLTENLAVAAFGVWLLLMAHSTDKGK